TGLLDRTHLRWFTPRMMAAALRQAGLDLADVRPRSAYDRAEAERFAAAIEPGLRAIGVDRAEYLNRAAPLQFVWRAKRAARPRIVVNATMLAPAGGVSDVRVIEPIRALASDCSVLTAIMPEPELRPVIEDAPRIAVLHRPLLLGDAGIARVRALLGKGYVVVTEFDDHPVFLENKGVPAEQLLSFTAAHAVQTSTETLAGVLSRYNPEIGVFPNGILSLPEPRNFRDPDRLTLFFGALNREEDWAPLMPVLNEVLRAVGSRLSVLVLHDRGFFDALETTHKEFLPLTDYRTYVERLCEAEICFMPLSDTVFNRAKSDLKYIEAGACRTVALASPVVYEQSLRDGETGLIFRSPDQLRMQLLRLLAYPEAARKLADAARDHVAGERMLAYQVQARIDWYRSLWSRRDELNEALRSRVPALFA
ncbi:MAG TPA: glycosyltransferase, partial [Acetobacteraceae bacterium]|nr:glycosyltransferase [Acetobacteraceae bacterium]